MCFPARVISSLSKHLLAALGSRSGRSRANHAALPLCRHEQQQQQCPGFVTLLRNSTTGVLTMAPNTSVTTIDPTENFLFGVCGDGVAMYTLDSMQRAR